MKCVVLLIVLWIVLIYIVICDCGFFILYSDNVTEVFSVFSLSCKAKARV